ncbi:bifunctional metallophosphatase/5'-nucleotidase [Companilactobacillus zhongbaensis]|uniref:bifunctional metallophosphatase/5'-nucleotidase n=1 Tax=Companilactobacillus zhongbaensis TaxID=2486009 RepID=UPI000F79DC34|nr:bifunctional UDP-sugar hydrolase/5'-nucleotidase [Companilactobacillus zhongbaensis]
METIKIVHTNDLHSHFENFPKIARFIKKSRKKSTADQFYLFDIGDAMDRAHPLTEATDGSANIEWMNQQNYDAATIGNNEGLGNSHEQLDHLYDHANFPVILGNLYEHGGQLANFAKPYLIKTTDKGTKVGIIGFTAPYILTYPLLDWDIRLIQNEMPPIIKQIEQEKCDVIILMSHLGVSMDRLIAKQYPQIDVILGSHTHHLFEKGEMDNGVLLAAAGKYGQNIGTVDLTLNDNHQITEKSAYTTPTADLKAKKKDAQWISGQAEKGNEILASEKVAEIPYTLSTDIEAEHSFINEALVATQQYADADAAVLSSGLFLTDLKKGVVTKKDLHEALPHAIHVMQTTLTGDNVWRLVMEMEKNRAYLRRHLQKGMGFRGKIFGELVYRGITIDNKRNVYINGQQLEMKKEYKIALLDHYLFVPFFPTIEIVGDNKIMYPDFIRNVFADYLQKKYPMR